MSIDIVIKQKLTGTHCLFIDAIELKCFSSVPLAFEQSVTINQPSLLTLLDNAGVSIARQQLMVQYLKIKRRRSRAPWSLF